MTVNVICGAVGVGIHIPGGVEHGKFPDGPAWVVSHLGAYDGLPAAWDALFAEAGPEAGPEVGPESGTGAGGVDGGVTQCIEIYVSDPSATDAGELRTDLLLLPS